MTNFRFIHLSDLHLCVQSERRNIPYLLGRNVRHIIDTVETQPQRLGLTSLFKPASYVPEIMAGVAQFCFDQADTIDGLIATGDLATTGMGLDIEAAYSFLSTPPASTFYRSTRSPTLGFLRDIAFVLPGNHDKFADLRATPNSKMFELKFAEYMPNFSQGVGHCVFEKQGRRLAFVFADFSLLSRFDATDKLVTVFGQGRVYQDILDGLQRRTLNLRRRFDNLHVSWVIHFAPFNCGLSLELLDFDQFIDRALHLKIRAVLCGHTHKSQKTTIDQLTIYCSGSGGCVDSEDDSRIHIIEYDVNADCTISRSNFVWDQNAFEFLRVAPD